MQNPSFVMNQLLIFIYVPNPAEPQCLRRLEKFSFCQNVCSHKKHHGNRDLQSEHIPYSEIPEAHGDFSCGSQLRAACPVLTWQEWIPRSHAVRALGTFPSEFLAQGKPLCKSIYCTPPGCCKLHGGAHCTFCAQFCFLRLWHRVWTK